MPAAQKLSCKMVGNQQHILPVLSETFGHNSTVEFYATMRLMVCNTFKPSADSSHSALPRVQVFRDSLEPTTPLGTPPTGALRKESLGLRTYGAVKLDVTEY
jgi:hypothetical protein